MAQFTLSNFNRFVLDSEDDANSPLAEELMTQLRENLVGLTLLMLDTGVSGTATGVSGAVLTDTGDCGGITNGWTLLITSGTAKGNIYTIDAHDTNTITCTGDNLQTDGVAATDSWKALYDLKVNTDGHDHDGVNSSGAAGGGAVMGPFYMGPDETAITYNSDTNYYTIKEYRLYIPDSANTLEWSARISNGNASETTTIKFTVTSTDSNENTKVGTAYAWKEVELDVSAMSGWVNLYIKMKTSTTAGGSSARIQGHAFRWS